ncbi:hypothetical protein KFE25_001912 [Diacronema lutheri]|uniref:4-hydroxy-3-methylbut-2-enyl diphosphate reductase n=2 Tax=Diacronema lutheri TaxID=2081491 RepID=A0A8J5XKT5_DIALT|nr:hypothetical protein KFE25_001912 [Diacronema lutheri]
MVALAAAALWSALSAVAPPQSLLAGSVRARVAQRGAPVMAEDKRAERRKIMSADRYYRGARPFDKGVHESVTSQMVDRFKSKLVQEMRDSTFQTTQGDGAEQVTFVLAKEYGFCWGVERSIELAWAAREAFPDKRMHLTNELIHNPQVNQLLADMDVSFIEKTADGGKRFDAVEDGDVVILPAFGASLEEMQLLDKKGVKVVDTTCPWVTKVWNTVDKHVKLEMTSIVHGKWDHEESIATASMAEHFLIVKNIDEAALVCKYILGEPDALSKEHFLERFKNAMSAGFDPDVHLKKLGLANQTTMYKKETTAISKLFEKTMIQRYGPEHAAQNYAAFDTICDATQVRQDAITEMTADAKSGSAPLDFILVVGGWDSSNTGHLLEIPVHEGLTAYHINSASCIKQDNSIMHRTVDGKVELAKDFLPLDRPVRIGVSSGASTPDSSVQDVLDSVLLLKKLAKKVAA